MARGHHIDHIYLILYITRHIKTYFMFGTQKRFLVRFFRNTAVRRVGIAALCLAAVVGTFAALDISSPLLPGIFGATCNPRTDIKPLTGEWDPFTGTKIIVSGNEASVSFKNISTQGCEYDINLASYKTFLPWADPDIDPEGSDAFIRAQQVFNSGTIHIAPGQTKTLTVTLPGCNYQIDLFEGPSVPQQDPDFDDPPLINTHTLFDWTGAHDRGVCVPANCDNPRRDIKPLTGEWDPFHGTKIVVSGNQAYVDAKNVSYFCTYDTRLASYEVFRPQGDPDFIRTQQLFDDHVIHLLPGQTKRFTVNLPSCNFQTDFFEGPSTPQTNPDFANPPLINTHTLFDWIGRHTGDLCGPPQTARITLIKTVVNDDGGTAAVGDFPLFVGGTRVTSGIPVTLPAGTYTASEQTLPGYSASAWSGNCAANGRVTLNPGDNKVCRITNNDIPVGPQTARITLIKTVVNDDSGTATVGDFPLFVGSVQVQSGVTYLFSSGTYTVSEQTLPGYTASAWSGDCTANGQVTLNPGDNKTCRITNNDPPVAPPLSCSMSVVPAVISVGGQATLSWSSTGATHATIDQGIGPVPVNGSQKISPTITTTYTGAFVSEGRGQSVTCSATLSVLQVGQTGTLTLIKTVVNDDGGTATTSDFKLFANGFELQSGVSQILPVGGYIVSEQNLPGYTASGWSGDCDANGGLKLNPGDNKVCRITNNDVAAGGETTLTLRKIVVNDNGGVAVPTDFPLFVNSVQVVHGEATPLQPGTYVATEQNLPGYSAGQWGGDCAADGTITLGTGDNKECTITNNDTGSPGCPNCGGGEFAPKVTLFGRPESNPLVAASFIYLSQLPYTGVGTSAVQAILFLLVLLGITGFVTYLLLRGDVRERIVRALTAFSTTPIKNNVYVPAAESPEARQTVAYGVSEATHPFPARTVAAPETLAAVADVPRTARVSPATPSPEMNDTVSLWKNNSEVESPIAATFPSQKSAAAEVSRSNNSQVSMRALLDVARENRVLVSDDGLTLIARAADGETEKARSLLNAVIGAAKTRYPREDGWLILDKKRVTEGLFETFLSAVSLFVEWMVRGDDTKVFHFLRKLRQQEQPVDAFIRAVVTELDHVYRSRLEGVIEEGVADAHLVEITYHLSNKEIEGIVAELLRGVDESYTSPFTGVKLAVTRVLQMMKERAHRTGGRYVFNGGAEQRPAETS